MSKKGLKLFRRQELEVMSDPERTFAADHSKSKISKFPKLRNLQISRRFKRSP